MIVPAAIPDPIFSPTELKLFLSLYKTVGTVFVSQNQEELLPLYRKEVARLIAQGGYGKHADVGKNLLRLLQQLEVLVVEMGMGVVTASALLFYSPIYEKKATLLQIEPLVPEGTLPLLKKLIETSEVYLRNTQLQPQELQAFLLSVAQDVRVVLILIAERLCALRTAKEEMTRTEQQRLALEVQGLFVPLAHRLGLYKIKSEMEDYVLKYTDSTAFYFLKDKLGQTKRARNAYLQGIMEHIEAELNAAHCKWKYTIKARTKSISSIHNKMLKKQIPFEQVYDLSAIRIILDTPLEEEKEACWFVYSVITNLYEPNTKRMRDWITKPRESGYESLHITVWDQNRKPLEVQIRTLRMDHIAEQGVAAHWRYKGIASQEEIDSTLTTVREALEQVGQHIEKDESALQLHTAKRNIFVFTPAGELIKLPYGATALDFAFAIHSRVGATAVSALVNGKNTRLREKLENGDTVAIQTQKSRTPSVDWLNFVTTRKAKNHIKSLLKEQQEKGLNAAKELLERRFKNHRLEYNESIFTQQVRALGFKGNMQFFVALGEDKINIQQFIDRYKKAVEEIKEPTKLVEPIASFIAPESEETDSEVIIATPKLQGIEYKLAQCCNPQPGDEIFAYPSKQGIRIHSRNCPNALDILGRHGDRVLPAHWGNIHAPKQETYKIHVEAIDNAHLVAHLSSLFKNSKEIVYLSHVQEVEKDIWIGTFSCTCSEKQHINALLSKIQALDGVQNASLQID